MIFLFIVRHGRIGGPMDSDQPLRKRPLPEKPKRN
jgi:hypothetical protein